MFEPLKFDCIYKYCTFHQKIKLNTLYDSCELFAKPSFHLKYQLLFSPKDKVEHFRMPSVADCDWHFKDLQTKPANINEIQQYLKQNAYEKQVF